MNTSLRVITYIKNKLGQGIPLFSNERDILIAYYDADWASYTMTRKSVTGFAIKLGDFLVL